MVNELFMAHREIHKYSDFGKRMEDCDAMGFAKYHGKKIMKLTVV